jgi:hypothetical protein
MLFIALLKTMFLKLTKNRHLSIISYNILLTIAYLHVSCLMQSWVGIGILKQSYKSTTLVLTQHILTRRESVRFHWGSTIQDSLCYVHLLLRIGIPCACARWNSNSRAVMLSCYCARAHSDLAHPTVSELFAI